MDRRVPLARLAAALLAVATIPFLVGVTAERSADAERHAATAGPVAGRESPEQVACERAGGEESCADAHGPAAAGVAGERDRAEREGERSERGPALVGISLESPAAVAAAVLVSLVLAAALVILPRVPWLALAAAVFAAGVGLLDLREVAVQGARGGAGLVGLAALAAVLHLGAAGLATAVALRRRPGSAASGTADTLGREGVVGG